ncbi:hypothetical protein R1sor_021667 [Riccia sorocarpa]|uniref:Uncharacterized protein n=1 Tax=Riccia sorocarpa TaxID=122646 RepID=A0ABD3GJ54_9MARC
MSNPNPVKMGIPEKLPYSQAIGIPYNYHELRSAFPNCPDERWSRSRITIDTYCIDPFLKENWRKWRDQVPKANLKVNNKSEVGLIFLFFAGLEKEGIAIDWSTVVMNKSWTQIPVEMKYEAKKQLFRMKYQFRGQLISEPQSLAALRGKLRPCPDPSPRIFCDDDRERKKRRNSGNPDPCNPVNDESTTEGSETQATEEMEQAANLETEPESEPEILGETLPEIRIRQSCGSNLETSRGTVPPAGATTSNDSISKMLEQVNLAGQELLRKADEKSSEEKKEMQATIARLEAKIEELEEENKKTFGLVAHLSMMRQSRFTSALNEALEPEKNSRQNQKSHRM